MYAEVTATVDDCLGDLSDRFRRIRQFTNDLCEPLTAEDCIVQSMPDASPIRWHLAHTTWFFETFLLKRQPSYQAFHNDFEYLFNSYYNSVGEQFPRHQRGLVTRPTVDEVWAYRNHVDHEIADYFERSPDAVSTIAPILEIGLHHEQQHQELMLTDIKHAFGCNPLYPAYRLAPSTGPDQGEVPPVEWHSFDEGIYEFGHSDSSFAFDNETPRHRAFIHDFRIANRLITSKEYLEFMEDDGYRRPELWLSMGWAAVQENGWQAPLYWRQQDADWFEFTLTGERPVALDTPVCHVSYFEADAFARWSRKRLPTEFEWELASTNCEIVGNFADTSSKLHPSAIRHPSATRLDDDPKPTINQMFGDAWEWTSSQYSAYPGYAAEPGAMGEYNGKFMCNQFVLRGGSCATSHSHIRRTYRNFFPPQIRWQFAGIRLAE